MRHLLLVSILALLLTPSISLAIQDIPLNARNIPISDQRKGANSVIASAQDRDGYMWFASIHGLYVYDGNQVRPALTSLIKDERILGLHIDASNRIWIATQNGILSYAQKTGVSKWYKAGPQKNSGLRSNIVFFIKPDHQGTLWVGTTEGGLYRYDETVDRFQKLNIFPPDIADHVSLFDLSVDNKRQYWLATSLGLYLLGDDMASVTFIPQTGSHANYPARKVNVDGSDTVWVSLASRGLGRVSPKLDSLDILPPLWADGSKTACRTLFADSTGDLWVGTNQGLFRYNPSTQSFSRHALAESDLMNEIPIDITSINAISAGTMWVGTADQGVYQCLPSPKTRLIDLIDATGEIPKKLLANYCLYNPADKRLWVAPKSGGLFRSTPLSLDTLKTSSCLQMQRFLDSSRISSMLLDSRGNLICGANNQFHVIRPTGNATTISLSPYFKGLDDTPIRSIVESSDGRLWFGNKMNIYSWNPDQLSSPPTPCLHQNKRTQFNLCAANTRLWILADHKLTTLETAIPPVNDTASIEQHIEGIEGSSVFQDSHGFLWIGSVPNLIRYNPVSRDITPVYLSTGESLPKVLAFWEMENGDIWMNTGARIYRVPNNSKFVQEMALGAAHPNTKIHGNPTAGPDGTLFYGHSEGVLLLAPQTLCTQESGKVIISDIRIFDQPAFQAANGRQPERVTLEHTQNFITLGFGILEYATAKPPRYAYKLEGIDNEWIDVGSRNYASFVNLDPGEYTFMVKEQSSNLPPASIRMEILPPWWLTAWAQSAYALCGVGLTMIFTNVTTKLQRNKIRQEMLETLVMQDPLTAIPNRRKFEEVLAAEKSRCARTKSELSLLMLDIDFFKGFNDRFGHQRGDEVLQAVAQTIKRALQRPEDFVARYGGEEFVVVLPNTTRTGAEWVAGKIQAAIQAADIAHPDSPIADRLTVSIGISTFTPESDYHIETGLFSADQALYQAKRSGRNQAVFREHILRVPVPG